ncbi:MAG TPA: response regulator [bacterium]|nr:response regulator [bacterium]
MAKKVLLIEDEEIILKLLQKKLIDEDYNVLIARNGEQGLKMIKKIKPDIILLDIIMPKMNGFEVMEEISKDSSIKKIPIIIISNSGQETELSRAKELGANDWLVKTEFNPQEVIKKVIKQIGK